MVQSALKAMDQQRHNENSSGAQPSTASTTNAELSSEAAIAQLRAECDARLAASADKAAQVHMPWDMQYCRCLAHDLCAPFVSLVLFLCPTDFGGNPQHPSCVLFMAHGVFKHCTVSYEHTAMLKQSAQPPNFLLRQVAAAQHCLVLANTALHVQTTARSFSMPRGDDSNSYMCQQKPDTSKASPLLPDRLVLSITTMAAEVQS